jgi:apolipoprotein N-acyltransferase
VGAYFVVLGGCFISFLSGGNRSKPEYAPKASATAVLVQPNLDVGGDDIWSGLEWDRRIAQYEQLSRQNCSQPVTLGMPETGAATGTAAGAGDCRDAPVLIAWPESPAPFHDADPRFQSELAKVAQENHAAIVAGNVGVDSDGAGRYAIFNSASVANLDGRIVGRYDKMHLVPFGEYQPLRQVLFFVHQVTQLADLNTGSERKVFTLGGRRYGIFICYESVFGDEVRQFALNGAEVLVNISDDGWYGDTSAPWQHLNMARMRAIENRRWILRDTNNGATVVIDPNGTVRASIPRHTMGALTAGFGYESEITFYTAHGDWVGWISALVGLGMVGWAGRVVVRG